MESTVGELDLLLRGQHASAGISPTGPMRLAKVLQHIFRQNAWVDLRM